MSPYSFDIGTNFKFKVFSINSQRKVLLFKHSEDLYYRSCVLVAVRPLQIPSLFPIIDLFSHPTKLTLTTPIFKHHNLDSYLVFFFIDLDLFDCPRTDYDPFLKSSLKFHKQQLDLLLRHIALKDYETKILTFQQVLDLSLGIIPNSVLKYAYTMNYQKEVEIFRNVLFSNNKIPKLDYRHDSIIPISKIVLGKTIANKDIGIDSQAVFLTGQKEIRRLIISKIVDYYSNLEDYHLVIFDFGLDVNLGNTFSRQFHFDDILFDPFTFSEDKFSSQHALFISHLSFIGKNILSLNDRQISILEEKLSIYLQFEHQYTWNSFINFVQDETTAPEISITTPTGISSFSDDVSKTDFTASLKSIEPIVKSNDLETLLNKLRYLDYLFAKADRTSLSDIFFKTHIDLFSITSTPDLKCLSFYLFNLFYSLNRTKYSKFIFMFLDIDSLLFDRFTEFNISWLHPDLKHSLFDSSDIYTVKKVFSMIPTRIYGSYISNTPFSFLSKNTKDCIEKLQFLHGYLVLEGPTLQRPEFFKLNSVESEIVFNLPELPLFSYLPQIMFSRKIEFSYQELIAYFNFNHKILKKIIMTGYLRKHKSRYSFTEKAYQLKRIITDYLSYQPSLTIEEHEALIRFSDREKYNPFFKTKFAYSGNIDLLCTRYLANQFINGKLDSLLLYYFLAFKKQLESDQALLYYLIISIQTMSVIPEPQTEPSEPTFPDSTTPGLDTTSVSENNDIPTSKIEVMKDYFSSIKTVLEDPAIPKEESTQVIQFQFPDHIQTVIDTINKRINDALPEKNMTFPKYPIFLIMKFLDSNIIDLLNSDIEELVNLASSNSKL